MGHYILIVGKDSYIGNHISVWLSRYGYHVDQLDTMTDEWKSYDYSGYDSIVHVAGIVHLPNCNDWTLYKAVNAEMPVLIATMAREQGVKQYIFLSTMGVYGVEKELRPNVIDRKTPLNPIGMYGRSKLMAEQGLQNLQNKYFNVVCIRPPSVYGKGCRGGYIGGFTSMARRLPVVPAAYKDVKQSFIYIDNLCEFIRQIIVRNMNGVFCPQDDKTVNANELLKIISESIGKKYIESKALGFCVKLLSFSSIVKKAYGGVEYSPELSYIEDIDYVVVPFDEGMQRTVE